MKSLVHRSLSCLIATALFTGVTAEAAPEPGAEEPLWFNRYSKAVTGTDDWQPAPPSGAIYCSDGSLVDPFMPECPEGSTLEIRDVTAFSKLFANDERLQGLGSFSFSASFDRQTFEGPAWGSWRLEVCDGAWEGTFYGERKLVPNQPGPLGLPVWVTTLKLSGVGDGGCVDRLRLRATEMVTTVTPIPLAYEAFDAVIEPPFPGLCGTGCLPEGTLSGRIFGRYARYDFGLAPEPGLD